MGINIEHVSSRKFTVGQDPAWELVFKFDGSESDAAALITAASTVPAVYGVLKLQTYTCAHVGAGVWEVVARYAPFQRQQPLKVNESKFAFDTTGGTKHITQSLGTVGAYGPAQVTRKLAAGVSPGDTTITVVNGAGTLPDVPFKVSIGGVEAATITAIGGDNVTWTVTREEDQLAWHNAGDKVVSISTIPDFKGAIGVTPEAVEGVDIVIPNYSWTKTIVIPLTRWLSSYCTVVYQLTGFINLYPFHICKRGEALFQGCTGSQRGEDDVELTYKFAASQTVYNQKIGDITIPVKMGWDYMWVRYKDKVSNNCLTKQPLAAYSERVYRFADFRLLGLTGLGLGVEV